MHSHGPFKGARLRLVWIKTQVLELTMSCPFTEMLAQRRPLRKFISQNYFMEAFGIQRRGNGSDVSRLCAACFTNPDKEGSRGEATCYDCIVMNTHKKVVNTHTHTHTHTHTFRWAQTLTQAFTPTHTYPSFTHYLHFIAAGLIS